MKPCSSCGWPIAFNAKSRPEPTCHDCRRAARERRQAERPARQLQPCGTQAAYVRHIRHGETPCDLCREAHISRYSHRRTGWPRADITPRQEAEMRRRARKCPLCDVFMTSKPNRPNSKHLDHIVPVGVGGTHTHGNVRIICRDCNLRRPKDGSDYTGPITLWAFADAAA